jgi:hypothetical protein
VLACVCSFSAKPDVMYWFYCGQWFDDEHGLEKSLTAFLSGV